MNCKPLLGGAPLVEIERSRYDELVSTETKYELLVARLVKLKGYTNVDDLKDAFGIPTVAETATEGA